MADLRNLSDTALKTHYDKLRAKGGPLLDEMINMGRGIEKPTETRTKSDPLSRKLQAYWDEFQKVVDHMRDRERLGSSYVRKRADTIPTAFADLVEAINVIGKRVARSDAGPRYRVGQTLPLGGSWGVWYARKPVPYDRAIIDSVFDRDGEIAYGISVSYGEKARAFYMANGWPNHPTGVETLWAYERDLR